MDQSEIKKIVAQYLSQGVTLSDIQKKLTGEHGVNMTFLDLRLMASEFDDVDWSKFNPAVVHEAEAKKESPASPATDGEEDISDGEWETASEAGAGTGKTNIELSPIARPGAIMSGKVKFGSGASAEWMLDQMGRLGLDKKSGEPNQQDIQEFQVELQKALSKMGF
ncbi:MAG: hypothetical protein A2X49_13170 [Lentisphaerae bacterium GWF2_52_8]|nr:MAG: hypothetical protein A2X49_13170 [Lentisphaerae bacterium GWF2_52_8]